MYTDSNISNIIHAHANVLISNSYRLGVGIMYSLYRIVVGASQYVLSTVKLMEIVYHISV